MSENDFIMDGKLDPNGSVDYRTMEGLAIVGFSLKFPQEAEDEDSFWTILMEGRNVMTEFPKDRINIDAFYHPDPDRVDTLPLRGGHFLRESLDVFDAPFFSISAEEASGLDPQQRILLEIKLQALKHLFTPDASQMTISLCSQKIQTFLQIMELSLMALDLACQGLWAGDTTMAIVAGSSLLFSLDPFVYLSNMGFLSPNSRCFSFDSRADGYARGEGIGVVIIKRIKDAIRDGDTIRAVIRATGSNQDGRTPGVTQPSKDSQAKLIKETYSKSGLTMHETMFFESHGTGTALGDPIEAAAIGTAFGRQNTPHQALIIGASKANIGHLEGASGVAGLIKTIMVLEKGIIPPIADLQSLNPKIDSDYLRLKFPQQSVPWPTKGVRRASINSFGFGGTNSHAILDDAYRYLLDRNLVGNPSCKDYERPTTNRHDNTLLNGSDHLNPKQIQTRPKLLIWSASDSKGIERLAAVYGKHFRKLSLTPNEAAEYLENLAFTLNMRRSTLPWKSLVVSNSLTSLHDLGTKISEPVLSLPKLSIGFVFTGQGAQWPEMGRELLLYPVFHDSFRDADAYMKSIGCEWSLLDELVKDKSISNIDSPAYSQPLCTSLQVALVDFLQSLNIVPSAVVGHSSGEIAAAYALGAISNRSAWSLAYYRGKLAATLERHQDTQGAMMAVGLSEEEIQTYFQELPLNMDGQPPVIVGCVNSPTSITVSGDAPSIDILKSTLDKERIFARKLLVSVAYHSPHMKTIASQYLEAIQEIQPGRTSKSERCIMISSVTGKQVLAKQLAQPEYWVENMVSQVRFSQALSELFSFSPKKQAKKIDGSHRGKVAVDTILEIGPHSALQAPIREILKTAPIGNKISYLPTIKRHTAAAIEAILETCGHLYCAGYPVALEAVNKASHFSSSKPKVLTDLPAYPFNHFQAYWSESRLSAAYRLRTIAPHDLLGTPVPDWNPSEARWRNILKTSKLPWIKEHVINGKRLYPAAGMLTMAIEAAKQLADPNRTVLGFRIKDVFFLAPLDTSQAFEGVETQLHLKSNKTATDKDEAWFVFKLYTLVDGDWLENCNGSIQVEYEQAVTPMSLDQDKEILNRDFGSIFKQATGNYLPVDKSFMYQRTEKFGFNYGPSFCPLQEISCNNEGEAIAHVEVFRWQPAENFQSHVIHPTTFDGIFQLIFTALTKGGVDALPTIIPTHIHKLWVSKTGLAPSAPSTEISPVKVHVKSAFEGFRSSVSSLAVLDADGKLRMTVDAITTTLVANISALEGSKGGGERQRCYVIDWKPDLRVLAPEQIMEYCNYNCKEGFETDRVKLFSDLTLFLFLSTNKAVNAISEKEPENPPTHLTRYMRWMRKQLLDFNAGILPDSNQEWKQLVQDDNTEEQSLHQQLSDRLEKDPQGKVFVAIARNLLNILYGKLDALSFLFRDDLVKGYYYDLFNSVQCIPRVQKYLDALAYRNPTLRVLEVGAGTGGMTRHLLRTLTHYGDEEREAPHYAQYDYTDISPSFFQEAQELFKDQAAGRMNFKILNIENDPLEQGFQQHQYDIVVASSVLHATKDLNASVQNIRKLLKPGGKLILFEITIPDKLRAGFVFGLLPGWWLGTEPTREWSPCVNKETWHRVLLRTGFSGLDIFLDDYQDPICHEMSIIISTAITPPPPETQVVSSGVFFNQPLVLVVEEGSSLQNTFGTQIKNRIGDKGVECTIVSLLDLPNLTHNRSDNACYVFLPELEKSLLRSLQAPVFEALKASLSSAQRVLWLTRGGGAVPSQPDYGIIDGLARVLRAENSQLKFMVLALELREEERCPCSETQIDNIFSLLSSLMAKDEEHGEGKWSYDPEYREQSGMLHIPRAVEAKYLDDIVSLSPNPAKVQPFGNEQALTLTVGYPGLLDTLKFVRDEEYYLPLGGEEIEIEVRAVGVNFRDLLTALGRINTSVMGVECAGIVTRVGRSDGVLTFQPGDHVLACALDTFRTFARIPANCAIVIPKDIPFSEAGALPANFTTAWHALHEVARIQPGESILIHFGAGGTGQASIQVAQYHGAEVYATVGSEEKRDFIMNLYHIPEDHIFYSRDTSFAQGIKRMTRGRGVDVVLNSLAGEGLVASWELVAPYGRFIEMGKKDIQARKKLPMFPFAENVSFSVIDIGAMAVDRTSLIQKALQSWVPLYLEGKFHSARPVNCYTLSDVEEAFRFIQGGKNIGKIVIEIKREDPVTDKIFANMPFESWQAAIAPKVQGTWNLHSQLPQTGLDFFVLLSSISGVLGSAGQANYAAGNSYLDALARFRIAHGQPAIAIDLGIMKGDGFLAENEEFLQRWIGPTKGYFVQVSPEELFALLDHYCAKNIDNINATVAPVHTTSQTIIGVDIPANLRSRGIEEPWWMRQPLLSHLYQIPATVNNMDSDMDAGAASASTSVSLPTQLSSAESLAVAAMLVATMLLRKLSRAFSISEEQMDVSDPLRLHGVDSLVALELRNWFAKEFSVDVAIFDLLSGATFTEMGMMVASRSPFCQVIREKEDGSGEAD
ncbi:hypothetical protein G7Y89_g7101 [Cudoniella acicularis]|uniref:Carrier domain-containing protein n=1 Tax=Cudoniella acicularis TaxID=354080 RepID=A0A8H4W1U9_9HELO|nr:hypothetical protein G7Y89_g7101 [Cudoniella acicularis]